MMSVLAVLFGQCRGAEMKIRAAIIVVSVLALASCSSANRSAISAWGQPHHVKQFSGGVLIGEWDSTGKIENEGQSDGYYFTDAKTGNIVAISGTVQITLR